MARRIALCLLLLAALTALVHGRALAGWDGAAMSAAVASRPVQLTEAMNWIFRLGFAQVDAAVALLAALWLLWRRKSPRMAAAPLLLFVAIGLQGSLRLVVDQPQPPSSMELQRPFARQPVSAVLDRTDAAVRGIFVAATAPASVAAAGRGSFPSGHAARVLFLALLAWAWLRGEAGTRENSAELGGTGGNSGDTGKRGRGGTETRGGGRRAILDGRATSLECSGSTPQPAVGTARVISRRVVRWGLPLVLGALVAAVSYSALFFGYHWPSDLLGGYLIALALYPVAARLLTER